MYKPSYSIHGEIMGTDTPAKVEYTFNPISKKPTRKYRKGSKYDPILEGFIKSGHALAEVSVEGKTASYLKTQLKNRLDDNSKLAHITVSTANGQCYLENSKAGKPAKVKGKEQVQKPGPSPNS